MDTVHDDVYKLMNGTIAPVNPPAAAPTQPALPTELYRVRKNWNDRSSQQGAFRDLVKAKVCCDNAGPEYSVFNQTGELIYPERIEPKVENFVVGEMVNIKADSKWVSGANVPNWVIKSKLYVREIRKNGDLVVSTQKTGAITGVVNPINVSKIEDTSYDVVVTAAALNVRATPSLIGGKLGTIKKGSKCTILEEKKGWGKIKFQGVEAWISLTYTKKV